MILIAPGVQPFPDITNIGLTWRLRYKHSSVYHHLLHGISRLGHAFFQNFGEMFDIVCNLTTQSVSSLGIRIDGSFGQYFVGICSIPLVSKPITSGLFGKF